MWTYQHFVYRSSSDGHLDCFYFLDIINKSAMNILVQVFVQPCFQFPWVLHLDVELFSHGKSMFNLLKCCQAVLKSSCIIYIRTSQVSRLQFVHIPTNDDCCLTFLIKVKPIKQQLIVFFALP